MTHNDSTPKLRRSDYSLFVALRDEVQSQLVRAGAAAVGANSSVLDGNALIEAEMERLRYTKHAKSVLIVDMASLSSQGRNVDQQLQRLRSRYPDLRIICLLADQLNVSVAQAQFVKVHGGDALFASCSEHRLVQTLVPLIAGALDVVPADLAAINFSGFVRVIRADGGVPGPTDPSHQAIAKLASRGVDFAGLIETVTGPGGFDVQDRRYRLKSYEDCFVGNQAVDVIAKLTDSSREFAVAIGEAMRQSGVFDHVAADHAFADENYFFRFASVTERVRALDLSAVAETIRGPKGFVIEDRTYHGKTYPQCFVGTEAVDWLKKNHRLTRAEAVAVGQELLGLHVFRHVIDGHAFADWPYFYHFG